MTFADEQLRNRIRLDSVTCVVDADQVDLVRHGHRIPAEPDSEGWSRAISQQGDLVALLEFNSDSGEWQPRKVFFQS